MPTDLYTVDQAAERLNTTPRFVRRLIAERRIPYVKLGRHVRIAEPDIAAFIAAGRVEPMDEADVWRDMRTVV
jgi:excisionase family DNA binding protein